MSILDNSHNATNQNAKGAWFVQTAPKSANFQGVPRVGPDSESPDLGNLNVGKYAGAGVGTQEMSLLWRRWCCGR